MLLIYLGVILILAYAWFWWCRRDVWIHGENIPGPRWLPLVGNLHIFSYDNAVNFRTFVKLFDQYGSNVRLWFGPSLLYVFSKDPETIKQVLCHPKVKDHDMISKKVISTFGEYLLVGLNGEVWKRHRKLMAPAFHRQILLDYVKVFAEKGQILTRKLGEVADGRTVDINMYITMCTFDAISETVIGVDRNTLESDDTSFMNEVIHKFNIIINDRFFAPHLLLDWLYFRTSKGRETIKVIKKVHEMSENSLKQKHDSFRRGEKREGIVTSGDKKLNSFLDVMIEGEVLTAEEIRDEITTLIIAGTDTTGLTMSYLVILLAIHADVQEQIHDELESIFGDSRRQVTVEDLNQMTVLERAIKEALRLFPGIPISPRLIPEDIHLSNGKTLPKGSTLVAFYYFMHRDDANFKDANRFWPDRWLPENNPEDLHPYAFLPFSAGPRVCMGRQYAMLQMKCTLSEILRSYHVTTQMSEQDMTGNLTIGASMQLDFKLGGHCVQLRKRVNERL